MRLGTAGNIDRAKIEFLGYLPRVDDKKNHTTST